MNREARDVIIRPVISEKSYSDAEKGKYTFVVNGKASKPEIRRAVEEIWGVHVRKVNTIHRRGKSVRIRGRWTEYGKRADSHRAIVTLAPGESISIFEG